MLKKLIVILFSLIILVACNDEDERYKDCKGLAQLISYGEVEDNVTLELHDMMYACGECLRLYQVDKVLHSENGEYQYYLNKEIGLYFLNKSLEDRLNEFVCKDDDKKVKLNFTGKYRRNLLGVGRLDVTNGEMVCTDKDH